MQSIIQGQLSYLPFFVLILAIGGIIIILLLLKYYQVRHAGIPMDRTGRKSQPVNDTIPDPKKKRAEKLSKEPPVDQMPLTDLGDITKNLHAVVSRYHLDSITLSTTDGLMIASTADTGQEDAAHFGHNLLPGDTASARGVRVFQVVHKGSSIIGIIRAGHLISDISLDSIRKDTEKIMNWWI